MISFSGLGSWITGNFIAFVSFLGIMGLSIATVPKLLSWFRKIGRTVKSHDREAEELFEDMPAWINEKKIATKESILEIKNDLNRRGFRPGTNSMEADRVNRVFAQNLRDYKKEEKKITRKLAGLKDNEGLEHKIYRALHEKRFPTYKPTNKTKSALEDWGTTLVFGEEMAEPQ